MAKTVLITGASTGIGRSAALLFAQHGWNVAATMRTPEKASDELAINNIRLIPLDVTDLDSIGSGVQAALDAFGSVDVLVNNAGYALMGLLEPASREQIKRQFETNVFGLMDMTRAVLPHFRRQDHGVIINVASIAGRMGMPLGSFYNSTKWAVEGFSEALSYELRPLNIRVKVIEPGPIKTDFYTRSMDAPEPSGVAAYDAFTERVMKGMQASVEQMGAPPERTAQVIYHAATDGSWRLRYPAGGYAAPLLFFRKLLPDCLFMPLVRAMMTR